MSGVAVSLDPALAALLLSVAFTFDYACHRRRKGRRR